MDLGLLEVNREDRIVRVYDQFCRMVGYEREELLGRIASDFLVDESYRSFVLEQNRRREDGLTGSYELPVRRKDGTTIWVWVSAAPVYDEDGQVIGSIGIHYDATEQKRLQAELEKARSVAREAQVAERQFLANISHEIRTPLNAIIGMTHLLYETRPNDEQREYLDILKSSSHFLHTLLSDLLDASVLEAGLIKPGEQEFDLAHTLHAIRRMFEIRNEHRDLSFVTELDPGVPVRLLGDEPLLYQVLLNLYSNAEKFTESGQVRLKVTEAATPTPREGVRTLVFALSDTGIGMDPEYLDVIFERFRQLPGEEGAKVSGAGLGLSIVRRLVELQGGNIHVRSVRNEGTVFEFRLPFRLPGSAAQSPHVPAASLPAGKRILVAEDNIMNRKYVGGLLDRWKVAYDLAGDGREALEKATQESFDLILMDIQMPYIDGMEVTRLLRHTRNRLTPVVALTASVTDEQRRLSQEAGMAGFLTKPFTPTELLEKLSQYLNVLSPEEWHYHPELDGAYLLELYGDDWSYAHEMFQTFLSDLLPEYQNMDNLAQKNDWENLAREAHKLNPPLAMVGLTRLQQELKLLEMQLTQDKSVEGILDKIVVFQDELSHMATILAVEVCRLAQKTAAA
ncbi:PAS domain-containing hybrid sensor histidine kinase/response regulator [Siphonobacter aquaeclarae]|nr:PAS domain-containing hybrid sensor histidine kinase/response regulator [Siphonobacter aquaeclarae]